MPLVAKFRCMQTQDSADLEVGYAAEATRQQVYLQAIPDAVNEGWGGRKVPEGAMSLSITVPAAFGTFSAGKNYRITIEEA